MPIINSRDSKGQYFRYGDTGKKYYYKPGFKKSRDEAYNKALKQMKAVHYRRYLTK